VPKVRLPLGGEAYLASRYEDVKRVLSDPVFSRAATSDPGVATLRPVRRNPYLMISLDAPEHTRVRRLVARASPHAASSCSGHELTRSSTS